MGIVCNHTAALSCDGECTVENGIGWEGGWTGELLSSHSGPCRAVQKHQNMTVGTSCSKVRFVGEELS